MDRIIRRTILAQRHAKNRLAKKVDVKAAVDRVLTRRQAIEATRELIEQRKQAIMQSKALWKQGPLAPNLGAVAEYGVVSHPLRVDNSQVKVRPEIVKERCGWVGGVKYLNLALGDRVVFIEGPWKGRIDTIQEIIASTGSVRLTNTKMRSRVPHFIEKLYKNETSFNPEIDNLPAIPISAIRLIHPIVNPKTGIPRDVIVQKLITANIRRDDITGVTEWDRVIPGLNVILPWPTPERPEHPTFPCDTTREDVAMDTFVPTLLRPPMPAGIIDELRGKYSPFRTRHEADWIAKKEEEEVARKAKRVMVAAKADIAESMMTPKMEASRARKEERRARGQPEVSEEMLAKIGEIMAKNQTAMCKAAGVKKMESSLGST